LPIENSKSKIENRSGWFAIVGLVAATIALVALVGRYRPRSPRPHVISAGTGGYPREIVETMPDGAQGERLVIPAPPQRIVSVVLAVDDILLDLVDHSRIQALSHFAIEPTSNIVDRVGDISNFIGKDPEQVIALTPDLCFVAAYTPQEVRDLFREAGIPVFAFHRFHSFDDVFHNIETIGYAVGAEDRAREIVRDARRRLDAIAAKLPPPEQRPSVLNYVPGGWVCGKGTTYHDIILAAGGRDAAAEADIEGFRRVSLEKVIEIDPDYFLVTSGVGGMSASEQVLTRNPALHGLRAVQGKRFVRVRDSLASSVSHYVVQAVEVVARQLYPDKFKAESDAE